MPEGPHRDPEWGSDVVAEMLRSLDIEYIALTPGASFRGLHDSIVNYLGNRRPEIILCPHEEIAVFVAHGYAKVTGRAMAVALHANVGLQHAVMPIFCAYADRQPVLLLGGNGPMDSTRRRPWIDWIHTTHGQGMIVRDVTKWEHQPSSVAAFPEAIMRAWSTAHTAPAGPVYLALDASLQEEPLPEPSLVELPDVTRYRPPAPIPPDPDLVSEAAMMLATAERPVILSGRGRSTIDAWEARIALAEALGAAVVCDRRAAASFPTSHVLALPGPVPGRARPLDAVAHADVILSLDHVDTMGTLRQGRAPRESRLIHISLDHYAIRSATQDQYELVRADLSIPADADLSVELLRREIERVLETRPELRERARSRMSAHAARRAGDEARHAEQAARNGAGRDVVDMAVVAAELSKAFGGRAGDVILTRVPLSLEPDMWHCDTPLSHLGSDGGGGVGSGPAMAVGVALAARGLGRPVVAILGDGDVLMTAQSLWTACHHRIPLLVVVANNQAYHNDEVHQATVARVRSRPVENCWVGQRMTEPAVDFAGLARSLGATGFGPVRDRRSLRRAFEDAVAALDAGSVAVVDVRLV